MLLKLVEKDDELKAILAIQAENHIQNISLEYSRSKGFVTVSHSFKMLQQLQEKAPQVIAKLNDEVVGYALVMLTQLKDLVPVLVPMFNIFNNIEYDGKPLNKLRYYVMGQICVKEGFKRQGVFKKLYEKHKEEYASQFDYCVTEVSSSNIPSMKAHEKVGFKTIHTFKDKTDEWNVLLWNWS